MPGHRVPGHGPGTSAFWNRLCNGCLRWWAQARLLLCTSSVVMSHEEINLYKYSSSWTDMHWVWRASTYLDHQASPAVCLFHRHMRFSELEFLRLPVTSRVLINVHVSEELGHQQAWTCSSLLGQIWTSSVHQHIIYQTVYCILFSLCPRIRPHFI